MARCERVRLGGSGHTPSPHRPCRPSGCAAQASDGVARRRGAPRSRLSTARGLGLAGASRVRGSTARRPGPAGAGRTDEPERAAGGNPVRRRDQQRQPPVLQVGVSSAGCQRSGRTGALLSDDQPRLPDLRQVREPGARSASELQPVDGPRRLLRERQRRNAAREVRHDGRALAREPGRVRSGRRLDAPLHRVLDERGPDRDLQPVRLRPGFELARHEPPPRHLARGLLRDGEPVQRLRRRGLRNLRPGSERDPRGRRRDLPVRGCRHDAPRDALGAAGRSRRHCAAAGRRAQRLDRARRGFSRRQPRGSRPRLAVPRRLRRSRELDVRGARGRPDRAVRRARLREPDRRRLCSPARLRAAPPREPEPADVPARVPELRRSRVARHQLHRRRHVRREPGRRAVVRAARPQRSSGDLPAGHVRARCELSLHRLHRDGPQRQRDSRVQQVRREHPPVARRDGTARRGRARDDGRGEHLLRGVREPAAGRRVLGLLQLDGPRSGGRLHVLVHGGVRRRAGAVFRIHEDRRVQVSELHEWPHRRDPGDGDRGRFGSSGRRGPRHGGGLGDADGRRRPLPVPRAAGGHLRHDRDQVRPVSGLRFRCRGRGGRHHDAGLLARGRADGSAQRRRARRLGRGLAALREGSDHGASRVHPGRAFHRSRHRLLRDHPRDRRDVHALDGEHRPGLRAGRAQPPGRDGRNSHAARHRGDHRAHHRRDGLQRSRLCARRGGTLGALRLRDASARMERGEQRRRPRMDDPRGRGSMRPLRRKPDGRQSVPLRWSTVTARARSPRTRSS